MILKNLYEFFLKKQRIVTTTSQENINHALENYQHQPAQKHVKPVQEKPMHLIKEKENHHTQFLELKKS